MIDGIRTYNASPNTIFPISSVLLLFADRYIWWFKRFASQYFAIATYPYAGTATRLRGIMDFYADCNLPLRGDGYRYYNRRIIFGKRIATYPYAGTATVL